MAENKDVKPHLYLGATGKAARYTSPASGGGSKPAIPPRNRAEHHAHLLGQLRQVESAQAALTQEAETYQLAATIGIQVEFESFPGIELAIESLADAAQKIELLNVVTRGGKTLATVFVPQGKLSVFERKLQAYLEERTDRNGKPRDHRKLVDAIQSFRHAALDALWSDELALLPENADQIIWWEIWLSVAGNRQAVLHDFRMLANAAEMRVAERALEFPERTVLLAKGSRHQLTRSGLLLNNVAELRLAKETADFFDSLDLQEQQEWAAELRNRLVLPERPDDCPYVCVLDTGSNIGHVLLQPFIAASDQFTIDSTWTANDTHGHGTGMAGLALWGDLTDPLASSAPITINHRLETVKLLRHSGDNEGKHLGILTADGVALPEIDFPWRQRVFAMALSSIDARDQGRPSAWSAALDSLAVDYPGHGENPRLFTVCAGNTGDDLRAVMAYPDHNALQDIHDPGQSWNAVTVGAYTEKDVITEAGSSPFKTLAPTGGLSPFSTTARTWQSQAPIKPEVVFEGGNLGIDGLSASQFASLNLLTTNHKPLERLFTTFNATSAATALASRFAVTLSSNYPDLWPETVRALMVHSAEWTAAMKAQFVEGSTERAQALNRLRYVGLGVPDLDRALWSANNSLALIIEDSLQPFMKTSKGIATRDMHLHELPWPREILQELGATEVQMTVTLSYFIEPNPSSRMVSGKYSYQSHGLRFDVKRSMESAAAFLKRINMQAREEEDGTTSQVTDPDWLFGARNRNKGSIHKDVWKGTAADLAERGQIAVYPARGWWRTRTKLGCHDNQARYALVVTIAAPGVDIDIYTAVAAMIATPVEVVI